MQMLRLYLTDKMDLQRDGKQVALSDLQYLLLMEDYKKSDKKNKFKVSGTTQEEKFELFDQSYTVSKVQDFFEYIINKHEALNGKTPVEVSTNQNTITFKVKFGTISSLTF